MTMVFCGYSTTKVPNGLYWIQSRDCQQPAWISLLGRGKLLWSVFMVKNCKEHTCHTSTVYPAMGGVLSLSACKKTLWIGHGGFSGKFQSATVLC